MLSDDASHRQWWQGGNGPVSQPRSVAMLTGMSGNRVTILSRDPVAPWLRSPVETGAAATTAQGSACGSPRPSEEGDPPMGTPWSPQQLGLVNGLG